VAIFSYKAATAEGTLLEGVIDAVDEKAAIEAVAKEFKIATCSGDRLVARRDGL